MFSAIRQIFLKGGTISDAIAYVFKATGNMPTKSEGMKMINIYKDVQKNTGKVFDLTGKRINTSKPIIGGKNVAETEAQVKARMIKENRSNVQKSYLRQLDEKIMGEMDITAKEMDNMSSTALDDLRRNADPVGMKKQFDEITEGRGLGDFPDDPLKEPDYASGGLARVGMVGGGLLRKFLLNKKTVRKAVDDIFPTGDYKYDAEMAAEALVENNPKFFKNKLYDDLSDADRMEVYGSVLSEVQNDLAKMLETRRLSKPTKTLEGIKKEGTIDISNPEVADEFSRFIKESDPKGYKKLEQQIKSDDLFYADRRKTSVWTEEYQKNLDKDVMKEYSFSKKEFNKLSEEAKENFRKQLDGNYASAMEDAGETVINDPRPIQSDDLFDAEGKLNKKAVLQEVKDSEEKMLLDRFNVKDRKPNASGGRVGLAKGPKDPSKRLFIKGVAAASMIPILGKYFKLAKPAAKAVAQYTGPVIEKVKGLEWVQFLAKRLWDEGADVTKQASTMDGQVVRRGTLESGDDVDMIYDTRSGDVSFEVSGKGGKPTTSGAYNDPYAIDYRASEVIEETGKKTKPKIEVGEASPRQTGPDDIELEGEMFSADDALSDLTELEAFAKKKLTKEVHKTKGTKPKNTSPDFEGPEPDLDDFDID